MGNFLMNFAFSTFCVASLCLIGWLIDHPS